MVFLTVQYHRTGKLNSYFAGTDQRTRSANCELLSEIYVGMAVRCKLVQVCVFFLLGGVGKLDFIYFTLKIWLLKVSMKSNQLEYIYLILISIHKLHLVSATGNHRPLLRGTSQTHLDTLLWCHRRDVQKRPGSVAELVSDTPLLGQKHGDAEKGTENIANVISDVIICGSKR